MSDGIRFSCNCKNIFNKIGNGNSGTVYGGIELLVQHKQIHCIVLLVLRNEFGLGLFVTAQVPEPMSIVI